MQHPKPKPTVVKNVHLVEGEEYDTIQPTGGCFLPWWFIIAVVIMAAVVMGSTDEQPMGRYTCYDSVIWGQWCE